MVLDGIEADGETPVRIVCATTGNRSWIASLIGARAMARGIRNIYQHSLSTLTVNGTPVTLDLDLVARARGPVVRTERAYRVYFDHAYNEKMARPRPARVQWKRAGE
jgi:hypothetical protein